MCVHACACGRGVAHILSHAISTSGGQDNSYLYGSSDVSGHLTKKWLDSHFTDENQSSAWSSNLPKFTQLFTYSFIPHI